jgi:hypothetical protein
MKTRTRAALMIAASFCLCSSIIAAQTKPDFSGVWKMNREKSKFPAMFPAMENIRDVVSKIEHKEPNFSESMTITGVDGDRTVEVKYTTDGKETTMKLPYLTGSVKATAKWEGDALTVEGKAEEFNVRGKYTLSADGKTLTKASHLSTPNGDVDGIIVFEKQF